MAVCSGGQGSFSMKRVYREALRTKALTTRPARQTYCYSSTPDTDIFREGPILTLERSTGASLAADAQLWQSGSFGVSVYPDLPAALTWPDLLQLPLKR